MQSETYRVIFGATGSVGRFAMRTIADRRNLALAGMWVHSGGPQR